MKEETYACALKLGLKHGKKWNLKGSNLTFEKYNVKRLDC